MAFLTYHAVWGHARATEHRAANCYVRTSLGTRPGEFFMWVDPPATNSKCIGPGIHQGVMLSYSHTFCMVCHVLSNLWWFQCEEWFCFQMCRSCFTFSMKGPTNNYHRQELNLYQPLKISENRNISVWATVSGKCVQLGIKLPEVSPQKAMYDTLRQRDLVRKVELRAMSEASSPRRRLVSWFMIHICLYFWSDPHVQISPLIHVFFIKMFCRKFGIFWFHLPNVWEAASVITSPFKGFEHGNMKFI